MHNPAKAHFTTLGSFDYMYEDTKRCGDSVKIRTHSNELRNMRHDYKSLLPGVPLMSVDRETKRQQQAYFGEQQQARENLTGKRAANEMANDQNKTPAFITATILLMNSEDSNRNRR